MPPKKPRELILNFGAFGGTISLVSDEHALRPSTTYRIKPEELYILSCEKGRGRRFQFHRPTMIIGLYLVLGQQ